MVRFEIQCGRYRKTVNAATPEAAWRYFITGRAPGLSDLMRFREVPWNGQYTWDQKAGKYKRGQWYFMESAAMDEAAGLNRDTGEAA